MLMEDEFTFDKCYLYHTIEIREYHFMKMTIINIYWLARKKGQKYLSVKTLNKQERCVGLIYFWYSM